MGKVSLLQGDAILSWNPTVGAGGMLPQMLVVKSKGIVHPENAQKNC